MILRIEYKKIYRIIYVFLENFFSHAVLGTQGKWALALAEGCK
jgi:hypothetical protein